MPIKAYNENRNMQNENTVLSDLIADIVAEAIPMTPGNKQKLET
jgi:hypothetical protein